MPYYLDRAQSLIHVLVLLCRQSVSMVRRRSTVRFRFGALMYKVLGRRDGPEAVEDTQCIAAV